MCLNRVASCDSAGEERLTHNPRFCTSTEHGECHMTLVTDLLRSTCHDPAVPPRETDFADKIRMPSLRLALRMCEKDRSKKGERAKIIPCPRRTKSANTWFVRRGSFFLMHVRLSFPQNNIQILRSHLVRNHATRLDGHDHKRSTG
jgi:hypothetical protein